MRIKIKQIKSSDIGKEITVKGWIRSIRDQKQFSFIHVNDGSNIAGLQIVADENTKDYQSIVPELSVGASVSIRGVLSKSPGGRQDLELKAKEINIIGKCSTETYPLQKKQHSFEFLRTIAHLRPRTNTFGAIARIRNALAFATHKYFQENGFLYITTPIITGSDCEGAGQMFQVTTLDLDKIEGKPDYEKDFFKKPAYLTVSGQLNIESYACALSDVYTFGPTFRAEPSTTPRHLAEFWMIEPEMAFADLNDNIQCGEEYIKYVINYVLKNNLDDLELFDKFISKGLINRLKTITKGPFQIITYTDAIKILSDSNKKFQYPTEWGSDLQTEHERYLVEEYFKKPVVITDYPKEIKAFYMKLNNDNKTVAAMDILVPKIGEIIGGSQREERLEVLEEKLLKTNLSKDDYYWYLDLRKYGTVPHAGFGLGFERLVLLVTGMENIRDVIPFPRTLGHVDF